AGDQLADYVRTADAAFGKMRAQEDVERALGSLAACTARAAFDGARMVATSLDYTTMLTLPGGLETPVVAITWVGTLPTHRRRGAMRGLIEATLADAREAGVDR